MKKPITVRVDEVIAKKLDSIAREKFVTRQDLIESLLQDYTANVEFTGSLLPTEILSTIQQNISGLQTRDEISFKRLCTAGIWNNLTDSQKRGYGKVFKQLVEIDILPALKDGDSYN